MMFFFHRYELPAVLDAQESDSDSDEPLPSENEALMPSSEILPGDTVFSATVDGNLTLQESEESSVEVNEPQENGSSGPNVRCENNNVKSNSKQTEHSPRQENNSNLVS